MPIKIRESAEPLSDASLEQSAASRVITAQSEAGRILHQELIRYCNGQMQGRSFLIAGHRGAGKTTMVADALHRAILQSDRGELQRRPLPVLLHGPSLFETLPSEGDALTWIIEGAKEGGDGSIEKQAQLAIVQIMLGLHRAVLKEYCAAYRNKVVGQTPQALGMQSLSDPGELAAQFEMELNEDPPAERLREFWAYANALESGILFRNSRRPDQSARELVALNGICNAHQRISGDLTAKAEDRAQAGTSSETVSGFDFKALDSIKPAAAVLAGAGVAGGAAAGHNLIGAALLGLVTALAASAFMKTTSSRTNKRERQLDKTFIPDLSLRTLDRILPMLLTRLREAGLAPVFVIDELDKVKGLSDRIVAMVHYLKKLVAESVFSCFLTDRGYLEHLRVAGGEGAYGVAYSYFSHPLLIAYQPLDIDRYLTALFDAPPMQQPSGTGTGSTASPSSAGTEALDFEVLKWVLRHRSQLHALALRREIAALPTESGELRLSNGLVRGSAMYRIDVTLQVAIELQLVKKDVVGWHEQRPAMRQILFDALYYISREWLRGAETIDLSDNGAGSFVGYLKSRMNLQEVLPERAITGESAAGRLEVLTPDDLVLLTAAAAGVATFLADTPSARDVADQWSANLADARFASGFVVPAQPVRETLLLGDEAVLRRGDEPGVYRFCYWPSGISRVPVQAREAVSVTELAEAAIADIDAIEKRFWVVLKRSEDPDKPDGAVYRLLGDELRVLPTTPAWSHVEAAIARLRLARPRQGVSREVEGDLNAVQVFEQMVTANEPLVRRVMRYGAFLGGIAGIADSAGAVRLGLALLAQGLRFAHLDTEGIKAALDELARQMRSDSSAPPDAALPPEPELEQTTAGGAT